MFLKAVLLLSLSGSVLALSLMLLRRISRGRISSGFFYWAWLIVLLRFALPVGLIPMEQQSTAPAYSPRQEYIRPVIAEPVSDREIIPLPETEFTPQVAVQAETKQSFDYKKLFSSEKLWLTVWVLGALAVALKYTVSYLVFSSRLRESLEPVNDFELRLYISVKQRRKPELAKSAAVSTPMLLGLNNPLLVLPKREYSRETLNNILRHEFTHYSRGDIWYKWLAMLIFALHWFNPLCRLFLKELDKVCELSCDEKLLRTMDSRQKQSYGETLLELAGGKSGILVTCLAMEKHVLKERLEQIMKHRNKGKMAAAVMLLCLVLLGGCAAVMGPDTVPEVTETPSSPPIVNDVQGVKVSTVDEFLDAIEPGASIVLAEGTFNLSEAENYGTDDPEGHYRWRPIGKGFELQIVKADGMKITGSGMGKTSIVTEPREANVLYFSGGEGIALAGFTAGHTEEPGSCSGGVVYLDSVRDANIDTCELFGCGTVGVSVKNSKNVQTRNSVIRDCNLKAVYAFASHYVSVDNCDIYNCGEDGFSLFDAYNSENFVVSNSRIYENTTRNLLQCTYSADVALLGNEIRDNIVDTAMFAVIPGNVTVEGCKFDSNSFGATGQWFADDSMAGSYNAAESSFGRTVDSHGKELSIEDLENMELQRVEFAFGAEAETELRAEFAEVTVKTVDEMLAAIAPNTKIVLDGEQFDLSTASDYGSGRGDWYYWHSNYDGPELVITGIENLSIVGGGKNNTTLAAIPRYANVLNFENCAGVSLVGFTAGHTEEPGSCSGGVLRFNVCESIYIEDCGLYGCGTVGIDALNCSGMEVVDTEIYDCSSTGFMLSRCTDVSFANCDLHDLPNGAAFVDCEEGQVSFNGEIMLSGMYELAPDGLLMRWQENSTQTYVSPDGPAPTPQPSDFGIWFGQNQIATDCTMRVGDDPLNLRAEKSSDEKSPTAVEWSCSDAEVLELTVKGDFSCDVNILKATKGGVQLTATRGEESATITVYCLP